MSVYFIAIVEFEHVAQNKSHLTVVCCFLCLLCRCGTVPTGICSRTIGGGSLNLTEGIAAHFQSTVGLSMAQNHPKSVPQKVV